jgi:uncharacterized membrane protein YciS (DUF1049 family)
MAALFLLLAIVGAILVGDLVLENTAARTITVLNHPVAGYSDGLLLAMAVALGFVLGLLVVGSVSTRRKRRARRRQLRSAEHELHWRVTELEHENSGLREELARRDLSARRLVEAAAAADFGSPAATERRVTVPSTPAGRHPEPVYEEARRVARLRSNLDSFPSADDRARA